MRLNDKSSLAKMVKFLDSGVTPPWLWILNLITYQPSDCQQVTSSLSASLSVK